MLKGSLGAGVLAMPMAFKNGGLVFGLVGTIIVGLICTHCVQMLVSNKIHLFILHIQDVRDMGLSAIIVTDDYLFIIISILPKGRSFTSN